MKDSITPVLVLLATLATADFDLEEGRIEIVRADRRPLWVVSQKSYIARYTFQFKGHP